MSERYRFVPLEGYAPVDDETLVRRAETFADEIGRRRTVRQFAERPVPRAVIEACLRAAGAAPSGANKQPWHFVAVSDPRTKRRIREAAEREEHELYTRRASREWLDAIAPLGTDEHKPFLETAPWLIAVFAERWGIAPGGEKLRHYYVTESVGLATGFLIAALHRAGLATLTHTPSPMGFLAELLERPDNERAFLLLVVGHPAPGATVPEITRKPFERFVSVLDTPRGEDPPGAD